MTYNRSNAEEIKMINNLDDVADTFGKFVQGKRINATTRRFNLGGEFVEGYCCAHSWEVLTLTENTRKFLQVKFDEQDLGDYVKICVKCDALSLWENGQLFAYDANVLDEEKVETNQSRRRERR